jgi:hypothetical protein
MFANYTPGDLFPIYIDAIYLPKIKGMISSRTTINVKICSELETLAADVDELHDMSFEVHWIFFGLTPSFNQMAFEI